MSSSRVRCPGPSNEVNDAGYTSWIAMNRYANANTSTVKHAPTANSSSLVTHESSNMYEMSA